MDIEWEWQSLDNTRSKINGFLKPFKLIRPNINFGPNLTTHKYSKVLHISTPEIMLNFQRAARVAQQNNFHSICQNTEKCRLPGWLYLVEGF